MTKFYWGIKHAKFCARFKTVGTVAKKLSSKTFYAKMLKKWNIFRFPSLLLTSWVILCNFSNGFEISREFCVFCVTILIDIETKFRSLPLLRIFEVNCAQSDPKEVKSHSFNFCNISGVLIKKLLKSLCPLCQHNDTVEYTPIYHCDSWNRTRWATS